MEEGKLSGTLTLNQSPAPQVIPISKETALSLDLRGFLIPRSPDRKHLCKALKRGWSLAGGAGCVAAGQASTCNAHIPCGYWVQVLTIPLLIQHPASVPGKSTRKDQSPWAPATHVGDPGGAPGSYCQPGPALMLQPFWVSTSRWKAFSVYLSLKLWLSNKYIL